MTDYIFWPLEQAGANPADMFIFALGILFAMYVVFALVKRERAHQRLSEKYDAVLAKYNQLDKLAYGIAIAIQKEGRIKLIKQSANGVGDHANNRDV